MVSSASISEPGQNGTKEGPESDHGQAIRGLSDELLKLRTGKGLVPIHVRELKHLRAAANVWKKGQPVEVAKLDDVYAAIEMVKSILEKQLPIEHRESLQIAYGLVVHGKSRADRIRRYLERPGNSQVVRSDTTIIRYSEDMAAQVAERIASLVCSDRADVQMLSTPERSDAIVPDGRNRQLRFKDTVQFIRIDPGRIQRDVLTVVRLEALEAGMHSFPVTWKHWTDHRTGVFTIAPEFGLKVEMEHFAEGITKVILRIPRFLNVGDEHVCSYRTIYETTEPLRPPLFYRSARRELDHLAMHFQFSPDAIPSRLWSFADLNAFELEITGDRQQTEIPHDGSAYVSSEWESLQVGLNYGLTWEW